MQETKLCDCGCGNPAPLAKGTDKNFRNVLDGLYLIQEMKMIALCSCLMISYE